MYINTIKICDLNNTYKTHGNQKNKKLQESSNVNLIESDGASYGYGLLSEWWHDLLSE